MALLWIEGFEGFGTTVGGAPTPSGVFARKYTVQSENGFRLQAGDGAATACSLSLTTAIYSRPT
jgi:hypothetical protein